MDYGSDEEQNYNDTTYNQERMGSMSDFSDGSYSAMEGLPSSNPQSPQQQSLGDSGSGKKRRFQVTRACLACATAHVKCEEQRPCPRCLSHGIVCEEKPRLKAKRSKTVLSRSAPAPNAPNRRRKSSAGSPSIRRKAINRAANEYENPFNLEPGPPISSLPPHTPGWNMPHLTHNPQYSLSSPMLPTIPGYGEALNRHSSDPSLPVTSQRHQAPSQVHYPRPNPTDLLADKVPSNFFDTEAPDPPFVPALGVHLTPHPSQPHHGSWDEFTGGPPFSSADLPSPEDVYSNSHSWNDPALTADYEPAHTSHASSTHPFLSSHSGW